MIDQKALEAARSVTQMQQYRTGDCGERALAAAVIEAYQAAAEKDWRNAALSAEVDALVENGMDFLRCANAIVGASTSDPDAEDAFDMFNAARLRFRLLLTGRPQPPTLGEPHSKTGDAA